MAGWLRLDVIEGRNLIACDLHGTSDPFVTVKCGWEKGKEPRTKTVNLTLSPVWDYEMRTTTTAPTGTVTLTVWDEDLLTSPEFMGQVHLELGLGTSLGGCGEDWFKLSPRPLNSADQKLLKQHHRTEEEGLGEIRVRWRYTFSPFGKLFAAVDEEATKPVPPKYSQSQLRAEVMRISGHGYNLMIPYWWLAERWYWNSPYESLFVLWIGVALCVYDMLHVAFPGIMLAVMINNYFKCVRYGPTGPEAEMPPALGFLGTIEWYKKTLQMTQNLLNWLADMLDSVADIFLWENQDAATALTQGVAVWAVLQLLGYFPPWRYLVLVLWIYLFTYFPLASIAPQLYTALSPSNVVTTISTKSSQVIESVTKKSMSTSAPTEAELFRTVTARIPSHEKRDGHTYFKVTTTFGTGKKMGATEASHTFKEFVALRTKISLADPLASIHGFPSTMSFIVKGEAITMRGAQLEAWLNSAIRYSTLDRGGPLRPMLREFLKIPSN